MPVNANTVEVKIIGDSSGFRRGADEAKAGIDQLTHKLREHKAEQIQEARTTRFYANEIANLGLVSTGTARALGELLSGVATGTGFGLALGAVKALVEVIRESGEESRRQAEAMRENYRSAAEAVSESLKKVRESFEPPKSLTQKAWEDAVAKQRERIKEIQKEIDKLVAKGPGVKDFMSFLFHSDDKNQQLPIENRVKELQAEQAAIIAGIESKRPAKAATAEKERREDHRKALAEMADDDAKWLAAESQEWKRYYDRITADTTKFLQDKFDAEEKLALDEAKLLQDQTKEWKAHYDQVTAETTATLDAFFKEQEAEAKKLEHELGLAAKELGASMGAELGQVLKGAKSIDDALQGVLATLIKVATQMALMAALSAGGPLGVLGGIAIGTIGGALGSLFGGNLTGGGGTTNHNHFTINGSGLSSRQMETAVVNALRSAQRRGRY